jgi:transposase InsO family protein
MPWGEKTVEQNREEFVCAIITKEKSMSALCRDYGITRRTGYKWLERYTQGESLGDRSHAALYRSNKTSKAVEDLILSERGKHPTWGAKKLKRNLEDKGYEDLPAASTITSILKRNGRIDPEESEAHTPFKRFEKEAPNQLWQMDFKGDFAMCDGNRCHPLTILDDHSRFLLCLDAKENEQYQGVCASLHKVFSEHGLPLAILCDNGKPWGDSHNNGYTNFDVWMMQLGILPVHGRPLHPQTQGKDERFHRTLKNDLLRRVCMLDVFHAQNEFDQYKYGYNNERPHDALELDVPAKHYRQSKRKLPDHLKEPEYDSGQILRKVNYKGYISIGRHRYFLSDSLINKYIALCHASEHIVDLYYGDFKIGAINIDELICISKRISIAT